MAGDLALDGFRYGAFTGKGPVEAAARLDWLGRQRPRRFGAEFWPKPYEQLAKVLREMGHGDDARTALVEMERLQRAARRAREGDRFIAGVLALWDGLLGILIGYAADTLLPVVNLEQRAFWTPDPVPVGGRGWWTRSYLWVDTLTGWALGLLAIAGFSGLVKSD